MVYRVWLAPLLLGFIASSGCGDNGPGPDEPPPATGSVDVGNDFFESATNGSEPAVDTVSVNGTITWTWTEVGDHGVAFDEFPDIPPSDILFEAGSQHSVTFPTAGTFAYTCSVHRSRMSGTIVVR